MRISSQQRWTQANGRHEALDTILPLYARPQPVDDKWPLQCRPDGLPRVERSEWVLEHHLHLLPDEPERRAAETRDIGLVEQDGASRVWHQAQYGLSKT